MAFVCRVVAFFLSSILFLSIDTPLATLKYYNDLDYINRHTAFRIFCLSLCTQIIDNYKIFLLQFFQGLDEYNKSQQLPGRNRSDSLAILPVFDST